VIEVKRTSLGSGDHITILQDGRDGVGLDWSRVAVATQVDVVHHDRMKASSMELEELAMKLR
jgi:hypothetical protein